MILEKIMMLSLLVFVICSMGNMGLILTVSQILHSLFSIRLLLIILVLNFIIAPLAAIGLVSLLPLSEPIAIGLLLLSTAAGAPILPKLAQIAKGNTAASVGIMVLLTVITVFYLPLVLPFLVGDVEVNSSQIVRSLIVYILLPLVSGFLIRVRYDEIADRLQPVLAQTSNIALFLLIVLAVILNYESLLGLISSFGLFAVMLFIIGLLIIGYSLGGANDMRSVFGLSAAQRNISAALVVAGENFGTEVTTYLLVAGVMTLLILMPVAGVLGRRKLT